jgi:hypothetical protein
MIDIVQRCGSFPLGVERREGKISVLKKDANEENRILCFDF